MSPDREALRRRLVAERAATLDRISGLGADWSGIVEASALVATDDEHDPEGATIAFERSQVVALLDQARAALADLDSALVRLDAGTYGACENCGAPISAERLAARPAARACIGCAQKSGAQKSGAQQSRKSRGA